MTRPNNQIRDACRERFNSEFESLNKFRAAGGRVAGSTCHMFPASVLAGLGFRPLRVLCGSSALSETSGERLVRPDVCPHVKSMLGNILDNHEPHSSVDLWVGLHTCDQMRRGMDLISRSLGKEVYPIQVPATRTPEAADYYAHQIRRFVSDIEARYGVTFCEEHALVWHHEERKAADVLSGAALSGDVSPLDLHAMFHLFFVSRPFGLAGFFTDALKASGGFRPSRSVVITGSPLTKEDIMLLEDLESRGIGAVPLNCTGMKAVEYPVWGHDGDDLVSSFAHASFNLPSCIRSRPNTEVYERIREMINRTGAAGLIVKCLKFCDLWYTERERLRKSFDVPVLVFDSDYAAGGRERMDSRLEAFIEMVE